MSTCANTVSELIEILRQYPGDWPLMTVKEEEFLPTVLRGIYIYEGEAHHVRDYLYEFYHRGQVPDEKRTIPALFLN